MARDNLSAKFVIKSYYFNRSPFFNLLDFWITQSLEDTN